jgi:hypothetical protein
MASQPSMVMDKQRLHHRHHNLHHLPHHNN